MKKTIKGILCAVTAVMMLSQTVFAAAFTDVSSSHWANSAIENMSANGIISGYEDGTFKPDSYVTRAEWAKLLAAAYNMPADNDEVLFNDMEGSWANVYANAVNDYFEGENGSFNPNEPARRADVAVSMAKAEGLGVSASGASGGFSDASQIAQEDAGYISSAVENGLIQGFDDGTFRPDDTLTRAEAATLLYRAIGNTSGNTNENAGGNNGVDYTSNKISAVIELSNGEKINLELYPDLAPQTVANFVALAKSGKYDGTIFHRVIKDFMIQGGGYDLGFNAVDADNIVGEFSANGYENGLSHTRGVISMARAQDYNSASSQFFIMHKDTPSLDGQYAAFGRVIDDSSMAVVDSVASVSTGVISQIGFSDVPVNPVVIKTITVSE